MEEKETFTYITAFIPFGRTESFILEEIYAVKRLHKDVLIIPRNPPQEIFHEKAKELVSHSIRLPLLNGTICIRFFCLLFSYRTWATILSVLRESRNFNIFLKNMAIFPKSTYISILLKKKNIRHIHAHWASTPSTMAYIIHRLADIPYSYTLHRWEIEENNMLKEKVRTATFSRCISEKGKNAMLSIVGEQWQERIHVIHMGVELPERPNIISKVNTPFIIMTPANLLPIKGHRFMIETCGLLKKKGLSFKYLIVGYGPFKDSLKQLVADNEVADIVSFQGQLPHEKVIQMYRERTVDLIVLPSINDDTGQNEGIPVALMEAMSYSIPVVSTDTGSIPELIGDGSGVMVEEKNAEALAVAIEKLMIDQQWYNHVSTQGYKKVDNDFNLSKISKTLVEMFEA